MGRRFHFTGMSCVMRGTMAVVGLDDFLNETMANHISIVEIYEFDAADILQYISDLYQAGNAISREIHLRNITGHDGFGMKS